MFFIFFNKVYNCIGVEAKDFNKIALQVGDNVIKINVTSVNVKSSDIELHCTHKYTTL